MCETSLPDARELGQEAQIGVEQRHASEEFMATPWIFP